MSPQLEKVLKLTSFRYKRPEYSDKEFHDFCTDHGLKAAKIQQRHGALKIAQYHTPPACKKLLTDMIPFALQPGWALEEHDLMVQVWVRTTNDMAAIFTDPEFQMLVGGSTPEVQDKAHITAGWEEVFVEDNKIVECPFPPYEERSAVGAGSTLFGLDKIAEGTKI
ncbi:hypothetical protein ACHAQE_000833 [Botrytis cinerea]|uniref:EthD domain-containing protein n=2 Tax=Botryotinia fuckeliana TaxID=40559 RepID=G2YJ32_BOTF4|nr:putative dimeric alpha-beta barrel protein [Botrytis cinerea BcDW1]CCD51719.1 hypothetical protein BofuT4_P020250.1 [Botrytis cinerea T4]